MTTNDSATTTMDKRPPAAGPEPGTTPPAAAPGHGRRIAANVARRGSLIVVWIALFILFGTLRRHPLSGQRVCWSNKGLDRVIAVGSVHEGRAS
ncbi:hypothetical protein ACFVP3_39755, partial [Streptomyces sp. NPDC057806]|uniref:hypothetical protein n=1 Tax=Streptomyces sp. NPDC057806 TaxID=3346255 RepID=UPI0036A0C617